MLVIDNYDSFTYNLVQYLKELGQQVDVLRNDHENWEQICEMRPERLLISPGPGTPDDAGLTLRAIAHFSGKIPILGVCLGHQAIAQHFGGKVVRASRLMHGRTSMIEHDGVGVFDQLPSPFTATRYHSLIVEKASIPAELVCSAWTPEGEVMGLRHASLAVYGVQFHPESFLSEHGHALLRNFVSMGGGA
ncbi:MAG: aminodeoxychorismate/anthranilate synthase component II [Myxococcales bacterium]|nr:MAG: aminodeoxychorismate/anthranilate synthase component II [Myxococcales bacterium]